MRIAMLGTRGVPARYGGFETAVEEVGARLAEMGDEVIVYCRNDGQRLREFRGMRLVNLPAIRRKSAETLSHTALSVARSAVRDRPDVAVVFNAANAPLLPVLRAAGIPVAVHVDGLEWKRAKWAGSGARYYRWAERAAVRRANAVIADARAIADHIRAEYGREAIYIPYGAPLVAPGPQRVGELGLEPNGYHLVVARFEPENHVREIVGGYVASPARLPLIVVGDAPYSDEYRAAIRASAAADPRVTFRGAIWDQQLLDVLYAHCRSYLHGHSAGGTNPSLLRALGAAAPVTAFDCVFNREVTAGHARFFTDPADVAAAVTADEAGPREQAISGQAGREHAARTYRWDDVARDYRALCLRLKQGAS